MNIDDETLRRIFERTEGRCHLCRKKLAFQNYAAIGRRGAWEIEHSIPRAKGGTNHLNNLFAAHISCNRAKGTGSSASARAKHGFVRAPYSAKQRKTNAWLGGAIGAIAATPFVPPQLRILAWVVGGALGAVIGHGSEPK